MPFRPGAVLKRNFHCVVEALNRTHIKKTGRADFKEFASTSDSTNVSRLRVGGDRWQESHLQHLSITTQGRDRAEMNFSTTVVLTGRITRVDGPLASTDAVRQIAVVAANMSLVACLFHAG
ncbi:MAG: hypothetical protein BJ554DRAFT_8214 [Olpidium bornovanus]|uniref:Uncharacterized protein n=1 Tax=Olpidium bornovanus TaxID=278681 RepID=A0A8H8DM49_9FUNG|nr:MAG: hypothetical protein BJ554DRAFT_8214 [Olpidium bornovanus]